MKKRIAILGSTGSIGRQALEQIAAHASFFEVEVLTAQNNADLLIKQAIAFQPNAVVIENEKYYQQVNDALLPHDIKVFTGSRSLEQIVEMDSIDMVLVALVGYAGLLPTYNAVLHKKPIALANKETLVVAGEIITQSAMENHVPIIPVDSEHSAIFQCLIGEYGNKVEKIILTASGGPFFGMNEKELQQITTQQALQHPNWKMGNKVTIDSSTLMNKGLEVIEAKWLFNISPKQIEVVIHPQSIIHSMVQFSDSSIKAQLGLPDMRLPIIYALSFPHRLDNELKRFDFTDYPSLSFSEPDKKLFRCLDLAYQATEKGGVFPCAMNAANEIAVEAFLSEEIQFLQIPIVIEETLAKTTTIAQPTMEDYIAINNEARQIASQIKNNL
ncbi:MAG TPA: 1-deoxy-D-xylulose-5-phosphate reductoisomerase [Bacteroidales bacterium]|jgi:1-deoxy-D-xylulose-5-phosphate reductoisomerase|nr:1-deoxy-D-xylulose-5-phosphate reductoisomerase [Bacteroidales bacterium]HOF15686.1 1-deoxy-D-xylulose-5-phosphate reductoisomerase [Bacteroidales bacterium]HOR81346.1 1-deoxy-D-xylulose-5-phosphate reductoisomerase [Bacteroidales bacterium]HPJ90824.1 1-deoxy-D-xylulose-5-phosphate reductoisomerase [Bacteroidales bacterium]HPX59542.1 1-deoxy-D-xylulose-5-phosphate reductoisomerase [Bacteroidales bacterium]